MNKKIFWKFFLSHFIVVFISTFLIFFLLKNSLTQYQENQSQHQLSEIVEIFSRMPSRNPDSFYQLTQDLSVRVTWIDEQGKVLMDNSVKPEEWKNLENHRSRPEVQEALQTGWGKSLRYSSTIHKNMMYVAKKISAGVLRVALPLETFQKNISDLQLLLFISFALGLFLSLILSGVFSSYFSGKISLLRKALLQIASGNFSNKLEVKGQDELAGLTQSINELSEKVSQLVLRITSEKNQLQSILDSMMEGVMVIDENQHIELINPPILKIFQMQEAPLGKTPLECLRNVSLQKLLDKIFKDEQDCEEEIVVESNPSRYLRVHISLLKNRQGAVIVFHDVSHLRKLEQVRREFVANASHELKTPLAAIKGYTETLLAGAYQDETHALKFLKIIENHANRLNAIIQDLLDLSRMESAQYQLKIEKIEIRNLFEELKSTFSQACIQKNIHVEILPFAIEQVWADAAAVRQILSNLIENAIKYSPAGASLTLSLEVQNENIVFRIQDTGPGIAPEHLPRLFERFYRVDPSRSREQGGTGLGLSIVKHLVQLHGGRVWVESVFGEGACFYVELPQKGMI